MNEKTETDYKCLLEEEGSVKRNNNGHLCDNHRSKRRRDYRKVKPYWKMS